MESCRLGFQQFILTVLAISLAEILGAFLGIPLFWVRFLQIFSVLGIAWWKGPGLSSIGLSKGTFLYGVIRGVVWSLGFGILVILVFIGVLIFGGDPFSFFSKMKTRGPVDFLVYMVLACMIGPVAEELVFRGIIYGYFRKWGIIPALFISSFVFVMLHSAIGLIQVFGGILFALAYEAEESLATPIVIHMAGNFSLMLLPYFA